MNQTIVIALVFNDVPNRTRLRIARNSFVRNADVLESCIRRQNVCIIKQVFICSNELILIIHCLLKARGHRLCRLGIVRISKQGYIVEVFSAVCCCRHSAAHLNVHRTTCCNCRVGQADRIFVIHAKSNCLKANVSTLIISILLDRQRMRSLCQIQIFRCSKRCIIRIIIPVRLCRDNTVSCSIKVCGHVFCTIKVDAFTCLRIRSIRGQENERIVAIFGSFNRYFCTVSNLIETCNVVTPFSLFV